jgi:hypothetical protein
LQTTRPALHHTHLALKDACLHSGTCRHCQVRIHQRFLGIQSSHVPHKAMDGWHACGPAHQQHPADRLPPLGSDLDAAGRQRRGRLAPLALPLAAALGRAAALLHRFHGIVEFTNYCA